ncbi:MAG TPA: permease, partial [Bacteroidales bacterium]|nr:permease [Bacteroidales bacterium]
RLEKWVEPWVYSMHTGNINPEEEKTTLETRITMGYTALKDIVGKVWLYVAIGIGVGAFAHGYVPEDYMASLMGKSVWYSVPLSVLIGIPLYSNAAGIVPIVSVLLEKGAALGTSLSFMMAVIGLSLPEMIILRKVLKLPLIFTFIGVIGTGIILVGYLFNIFF